MAPMEKSKSGICYLAYNKHIRSRSVLHTCLYDNSPLTAGL
jgi:hypothetical protein